FGFAVPFIVGAALSVVALVLVYSEVEETLEDTAGFPVPSPGD
ncbi:MAG: hypothetical protein ABEJ71_04470, partial [Halodesulfurarchaeum sp.]